MNSANYFDNKEFKVFFSKYYNGGDDTLRLFQEIEHYKSSFDSVPLKQSKLTANSLYDLYLGKVLHLNKLLTDIYYRSAEQVR
jgi:hypothetical protein